MTGTRAPTPPLSLREAEGDEAISPRRGLFARLRQDPATQGAAEEAA